MLESRPAMWCRVSVVPSLPTAIALAWIAAGDNERPCSQRADRFRGTSVDVCCWPVHQATPLPSLLLISWAAAAGSLAGPIGSGPSQNHHRWSAAGLVRQAAGIAEPMMYSRILLVPGTSRYEVMPASFNAALSVPSARVIVTDGLCSTMAGEGSFPIGDCGTDQWRTRREQGFGCHVTVSRAVSWGRLISMNGARWSLPILRSW